jgi:hypothetical protein
VISIYLYVLSISLHYSYNLNFALYRLLRLVDSCTTNTILRELKIFQTLTNREGQVLTIAGRDAMIVGSSRATIVLPMGTQINIEEALLYPDSTRTLLSYNDIRKNGIHVETHDE